MNDKTILILVFSVISMHSYAGYVGNVTPSDMFGAGSVRFGIDNPPADTCNYYGRDFIFDATTEAGKNMLSILLSAMMAGRVVDIWYTPSTAPGTSQGGGCTASTMAVVTSIGIN